MDTYSNDCVCFPEIINGYKYIQWIGKYFGDCVYTPLEIFSYFSGVLSIAFYFIAFYPQLYENYKRKRTDGLSVYLFIIWFFGDFSNYAGTVLTEQYPTQKLVGIYFMFVDIIIIIQFLYYKFYYQRRPNISTITSSIASGKNENNQNIIVSNGSNGNNGEYEQLINKKEKEDSKELKKRKSFSNCQKNYCTFDSSVSTSSSQKTDTASSSLIKVKDKSQKGNYNKNNSDSDSDSDGSKSDSDSDNDSNSDNNNNNNKKKYVQKSEKKKFLTMNKRQSTKVLSQLHTTLLLISMTMIPLTIFGQVKAYSINYKEPVFNMGVDDDSGVIEKHLCNEMPNLTEFQQIVGIIMAWSSGLLYFTSRIPQILENKRNHSVDGLSLLLFLCTIFGNLFYGLSIFTRFPKIDKMFYLSTFPYLLGSVGTFIFDIIIIYQFNKYKKERSLTYQHLQ